MEASKTHVPHPAWKEAPGHGDLRGIVQSKPVTSLSPLPFMCVEANQAHEYDWHSYRKSYLSS